MNQSQNNFSTIKTPNKLYKTFTNKLYWREYRYSTSQPNVKNVTGAFSIETYTTKLILFSPVT